MLSEDGSALYCFSNFSSFTADSGVNPMMLLSASFASTAACEDGADSCAAGACADMHDALPIRMSDAAVRMFTLPPGKMPNVCVCTHNRVTHLRRDRHRSCRHHARAHGIHP